MSLLPLIQERLAEQGAISVADYMSLALSHPEHGYYMRKDPFGRKGDFITAPEISQMFGELIGAWCADVWMQLGGEELLIVEVGPGRGTLMSDFLRATAQIPGFHDSLCITMVEMSPALIQMQKSALDGAHPRIHWQGELEDLPRMPVVFIANEFFDALPIRQFVKTEHGLREKMVELDPDDADKLCFTVKEMGLRLVKGGAYSDDGVVVETCPSARQVMQKMCDHINQFGGAGLAIDYGYTGGSRGNSLQAVREHGFHDVLEMPGKADITAHVDFDALREVLEENQLVAPAVIGQGTFLQRLGIELRADVLMRKSDEAGCEAIAGSVDRLISPTQMGDLFKVLAFHQSGAMHPAGFAMPSKEEGE